MDCGDVIVQVARVVLGMKSVVGGGRDASLLISLDLIDVVGACDDV